MQKRETDKVLTFTPPVGRRIDETAFERAISGEGRGGGRNGATPACGFVRPRASTLPGPVAPPMIASSTAKRKQATPKRKRFARWILQPSKKKREQEAEQTPILIDLTDDTDSDTEPEEDLMLAVAAADSGRSRRFRSSSVSKEARGGGAKVFRPALESPGRESMPGSPTQSETRNVTLEKDQTRKGAMVPRKPETAVVAKPCPGVPSIMKALASAGLSWRLGSEQQELDPTENVNAQTYGSPSSMATISEEEQAMLIDTFYKSQGAQMIIDMLDTLEGNGESKEGLRAFSELFSGEVEGEDEDGVSSSMLSEVFERRNTVGKDGEEAKEDEESSANSFVQLVLVQDGMGGQGADATGDDGMYVEGCSIERGQQQCPDEFRAMMRRQDSPLEGSESSEGEEVEVEEEGRINVNDIDIQAIEDMINKELGCSTNTGSSTSSKWEQQQFDEGYPENSSDTSSEMLPLMDLFTKSPRGTAYRTSTGVPSYFDVDAPLEADDTEHLGKFFEELGGNVF